MRVMRPVRNAQSRTAAAGVNRAVLFLLFFVPVLLMAASAFAGSQNLEKYASEVGTRTNVIVDIFSYVSFLIGAVLSGLAIMELRRHVENPGNVPLKHPITKLVAGGIFLGLPFIAGVLADTMGVGYFDPFQVFKMNAFKYGEGVKANGISGLIANGINNAGVLINVAAFASFIIAVFFFIRGIQMVRAHIDNPGNAPLAEGLKRLAVGGVLFSLPMIVNVVYETFGAKAQALGNTGWSGATRGGSGLDGMMVNFISDITASAFFGIEVFCYIAGILLVFFAMQRMVRTAQDGPRGPLGFGTITMFVVAGALLSFPQLLTVIDNSLLGGGVARTQVEFMALNGAVDQAQIQNAKNVMSAVLAFMAVIGFLSVVRGLFILKAFADGNGQATMMSVVTHIVAGSLAINLGAFANAIQTSLGLTSFPVTFN